ncbi:hypothetical protein [Aeribacillus sp. FSL M8-0235]|uniref:hypothetical protein n=1 Tax=Aeribacillus sp. FSL M8-0235 TaxID=2954576 RepID=UPI0030F87086
MNESRREFLEQGLNELPKEFVENYIVVDGKNGETLAAYDEAEVWKRVLNYRLAHFLHPYRIVETHGGLGVSTALYRMACDAEIISCSHFQSDLLDVDKADFIDIDPFGQPYEALKLVLDKIDYDRPTVLLVSNGEMMSVVRRLKNTQYLKTEYYGKTSHRWVEEQYIPFLEEKTKLKTQFYYIFPSTVRVVLSNMDIPKSVFSGCKKYMWWIEKYAVVKTNEQ